MTRLFALVATVGLLAPRVARADKWGCDSIAGVENGTAGGHCCDFHDMCYAQNGCSMRPERMGAAGACTDCDMRGDPALCDACYVAAYAYFGDACFDCDHAVPGWAQRVSRRSAGLLVPADQRLWHRQEYSGGIRGSRLRQRQLLLRRNVRPGDRQLRDQRQ